MNVISIPNKLAIISNKSSSNDSEVKVKKYIQVKNDMQSLGVMSVKIHLGLCRVILEENKEYYLIIMFFQT